MIRCCRGNYSSASSGWPAEMRKTVTARLDFCQPCENQRLLSNQSVTHLRCLPASPRSALRALEKMCEPCTMLLARRWWSARLRTPEVRRTWPLVLRAFLASATISASSPDLQPALGRVTWNCDSLRLPHERKILTGHAKRMCQTQPITFLVVVVSLLLFECGASFCVCSNALARSVPCSRLNPDHLKQRLSRVVCDVLPCRFLPWISCSSSLRRHPKARRSSPLQLIRNVVSTMPGVWRVPSAGQFQMTPVLLDPSLPTRGCVGLPPLCSLTFKGVCRAPVSTPSVPTAFFFSSLLARFLVIEKRSFRTYAHRTSPNKSI